MLTILNRVGTLVLATMPATSSLDFQDQRDAYLVGADVVNTLHLDYRLLCSMIPRFLSRFIRPLIRLAGLILLAEPGSSTRSLLGWNSST